MTKDLAGRRYISNARILTIPVPIRSTMCWGRRCWRKDGQDPHHRRDGRRTDGVAAATATALMDLECEIFMGKEDTERQALNVTAWNSWARRSPVTSGTMTLKDAVNETLRVDGAYHRHPLRSRLMGPTLSRPLSGISRRHRPRGQIQLLEREGRLPDAVIACVGGGNAIGIFHDFISAPEVRLVAARPPAGVLIRSGRRRRSLWALPASSTA